MYRTSPHGIQAEAHTPVRMGRNGMVVANQPLGAIAGMRILQKGGNAVDAATAISFALGVVEPQMSGLGGDGYIMIHMNDSGRIEVANGTGPTPLAATRDRYLGGIPVRGILSVSVPGILDAVLEAHARHGALSLAEVVEPAIEYAENGFPITHFLSEQIASVPELLEYPESAAIWSHRGMPMLPGTISYNPNLAKTMRAIVEGGSDAFYRGPIAREMVRASEKLGGLLTETDLARFRMRWDEPISTTYRGFTVYEAPPNSSGHVLLQELNLIENFDLTLLGPYDPATTHIMVEAKKLAFADREAYLADPDYVHVPVEGLLSKEYAFERSRLINTDRAAEDVREGDPWAFQSDAPDPWRRFHRPASGVTQKAGDTTHFCVVDRWGNAVGQLQSIQMGFGSAVVAGETGVLLNNRMTYCHLDPSHMDSLEPGKRVRHTMNPVMVFNGAADAGGKLVMALGTPGADNQVQVNMQVLSLIVDHGYTVSEAVEATRWAHTQKGTVSVAPHGTEDVLQIESRVPQEVIDGLHERGHVVRVVDAFGGPCSEGVIQVDEASGAYLGAADPRRDGQALAW